MIGLRLPNLPTPYIGEPAHRFFMAVADLNGYTSSDTLRMRYEMQPRRQNPAEMLEFLLSMDIPDEAKARLVQATPVIEGNTVTLMGETMRRSHWRPSPTRFCPACLQEAAFCRTWWDISYFRCCPIHGRNLTSIDEGGHELPDWWSRMKFSPAGHPLTVADTRRVECWQPTIEGFILGRLGILPRVEVPLLDEKNLGDVFDALDFLESIAPEDGSMNAPTARFAALAGGEAGIDSFLGSIYDDAYVRLGRTQGLGNVFGTKYIFRLNETRNDLISTVHQRMQSFATKTASFSRINSGAWRTAKDICISVPNLAAELDMTEANVRRIADRLNIKKLVKGRGLNHFDTFKADEARQIREVMETALTDDEAAMELGITEPILQALIHAKLVERIARFRDGDRFVTKISRVTIEWLNGMVRSFERLDSCPFDATRVGDLTRTAKKNPTPEIEKVIYGSAEILGVVGDRFGDIIIKPTEKSLQSDKMKSHVVETRRRTIDGGELGLMAAASWLGVRHEGLTGIIAVGALRTGSQVKRIQIEELRCFSDTWAPASIYGTAFTKGNAVDTSFLVGKKIRHMNVQAGESRLTYINREDARRVLRLASDPDALIVNRFAYFMKQLYRTIAETTTFHASTLLTDASSSRRCVVSSTSGRIFTEMVFEVDDRHVVFTRKITRGAEGSRPWRSARAIESEWDRVPQAIRDNIRLTPFPSTLTVTHCLDTGGLFSGGDSSDPIAMIIDNLEVYQKYFSLLRN